MRRKSEHKAKLDDFERKMDQARVQYENYFSGIDGREPTWLRNEINKIMKFFRRCHFNSPIDRSRFSTLASRYGILSRNWDIVMREQEEGTFRKQHMRGRQGSASKQSDEPDVPGALEADSEEPTPPNESPPKAVEPPQAEPSQQPVKQPPQTEAPQLPVQAEALQQPKVEEASSPVVAKEEMPKPKKREAFGVPYKVSEEGFKEEEVRPLFSVYLEAKQQCEEPVEELSFPVFAERIKRQIPQLEGKGYEKIRFQIFVDGGKAIVKAMGKKTKTPT